MNGFLSVQFYSRYLFKNKYTQNKLNGSKAQKNDFKVINMFIHFRGLQFSEY